jgi:predicted MFS family arabinose efflux permease
MPRATVWLLATVAGISVANLYYAQPLLHLIGDSLGVSPETAGLLVAGSQLGYAVGLLFLVPLGDLVERRGLISGTLLLTALAAAGCAVAPTFGALAAALVVLGVLAVVAQIAVPLAAALAAEHERGAVVGQVMSGLLVGILLARTFSGLIAEVGGWRAVYAASAVLLVGLSFAVRRGLPHAPRTDDSTYRQALRSVAEIVRNEPVLRQRMAMGACNMAGFSLLWTGSALLLGGAPYDFSEGTIGLVGLVGVAGVLVAPQAGKLADRGFGRAATTGFSMLLLLSWPLLWLGGEHLVALLLGVLLFDIGVHGAQISNQSVIYALRPEARSRITTAYISAYFGGAVVGSALAAATFGAGGWPLACVCGAVLAAIPLMIWASTQRLAATPA